MSVSCHFNPLLTQLPCSHFLFRQEAMPHVNDTCYFSWLDELPLKEAFGINSGLYCQLGVKENVINAIVFAEVTSTQGELIPLNGFFIFSNIPVSFSTCKIPSAIGCFSQCFKILSLSSLKLKCRCHVCPAIYFKCFTEHYRRKNQKCTSSIIRPCFHLYGRDRSPLG